MKTLKDYFDRASMEIYISIIMLVFLWQYHILIFSCFFVVMLYIIRLRLQMSYQQTLNIQLNKIVGEIKNLIDEEINRR